MLIIEMIIYAYDFRKKKLCKPTKAGEVAMFNSTAQKDKQKSLQLRLEPARDQGVV